MMRANNQVLQDFKAQPQGHTLSSSSTCAFESGPWPCVFPMHIQVIIQIMMIYNLDKQKIIIFTLMNMQACVSLVLMGFLFVSRSV